MRLKEKMPVFTANIPGMLKVGDKIEIGGKIKENARKMSVNLCAQEGEEPRDVVLHFDVRFHRDNIISLSRKNGVWIGSGNYDTNYNMFVPGTIFRIVFEIKDTDVITIYCQGKFHSNFLPKIPLSMAKYIVAWADVERVTHCYFHLGYKAPLEDPETQAPRIGIGPTLVGDVKRCSRIHKKSAPSSPQVDRTSIESSDDDQTVQPEKPRTKQGRADRFFYETLLCQPPEPNFITERRRNSTLKPRQEFRKYIHDVSDTDKIESEDYSEEILSKNMESSVVDSEEVLPGLKKRSRRGKFGPFAQVVNFMGKNTRRN